MLFYIMSPYSGSRAEMFLRHIETSKYSSHLLNEGIPVFSPILHWHFSAHEHGLPKDAGFWREYNKELYGASTAGILLMMEGWDKSKGIREELDWHERDKKPVYMLNLERPEIDGYVEKSFRSLLRGLRNDFPSLKQA